MVFHTMEDCFAIWLRATLGPCPEAGLACGNPFAKRARSTLWKECLPLRSRGSLARSAGHFAIDRRVPPSSRKCGTRARHSAIPRCGKKRLIFPQYGRLFNDFSTLWKIVFHSVENQARFFHSMEEYFGSFPHYGKKFSTVWKRVGFASCDNGMQ